MRVLQILALLFTFMHWGSSITSAQTEEWATPPAHRHGLDEAREMQLFGPFSDEKGAGIIEYLIEEEEMRRWQHMNGGTHWFEEECCSENDCKQYARSDIIFNIDGSLSVRYGMKWLEVPKNIIKPRPSDATHDDEWYVCIYDDGVIEGDEPFAICAYPPDLNT